MSMSRFPPEEPSPLPSPTSPVSAEVESGGRCWGAASMGSLRRSPRSWTTRTRAPRCGGGVAASRASSSCGMTYAFEVQPTARGRNAASVTRLARATQVGARFGPRATRRRFEAIVTRTSGFVPLGRAHPGPVAVRQGAECGAPATGIFRSAVLRREDRLEVEDRRAVERLDRPDLEARAGDPADRHAMEADGVRAIGRARREHARQPAATIAARMDLQPVASRAIEPGEDDELVTGRDPGQRGREGAANLEPGVGRALAALPGRGGAALEPRADGRHHLQR